MKSVILSMLMFVSMLFGGANCDKPISQYDMNVCSSNSLEESNVKMQKIYDELYSLLNAEDKLKLKTEQDKWYIFRNTESQKELDELGVGGTMASSILTSSKKYYTDERIKELTKKLNTLKK